MAAEPPFMIRYMVPCSRSPSGMRATTSVERISDGMKLCNHNKRGFVIYRCTYADDDAWARFMSNLKARFIGELGTFEGGPDLAKKLVWTVHEDREHLDGASVDQVRNHFRTWLDSEAARAEQPGVVGLADTTRYTYPIHVDAAALESCSGLSAQYDDIEIEETKSPYVNIVDAIWEPYPELEEDLKSDPYDMTINIGWMSVAVYYIGPELYAMLKQRGSFYAVYRKPPERVFL